MKHLPFHIPSSDFKIDHKLPVALIGSCFSDEIGAQFKLHGFSVHANPFGTIFHPDVIARNLIETCNTVAEERTFLREDVYLSWDAGSTIYGMSHEELITKLSKLRSNWRQTLSTASTLFITFGTAWGYQLKSNGHIVANCHKLPGDQFERSLYSSESMLDKWIVAIRELKILNPNLKIVFTVSPVRHSKEGLVENNRSKAELIRLVAQLDSIENCSYFPSYELVIDVLRDYRYFANDLVHPSSEAVQYVWDKLSELYFSCETLDLARKVRNIRIGEEHRSLHPESSASKKFIEELESKKQQLLNEFPFLQGW